MYQRAPQARLLLHSTRKLTGGALVKGREAGARLKLGDPQAYRPPVQRAAHISAKHLECTPLTCAHSSDWRKEHGLADAIRTDQSVGRAGSREPKRP